MSAPVYVVFMYSALCVQRCWMLVFLSTCSCRDIISSLAPRGWPSHEFDHKGCIIVEEEAQAGGDQREEDLRPAAQVQALLEAPGKKHQLQGIPGLFLGKDEPTWKIQLITNLNPSSTKLTQKIKRNIAATKKSSKISSKCSRMGAASNGTFSSNFSVTLIRQRALMAPLSSPGSSCRFNGLRPKFIGKDCAVPSPKKPGRKSERWDSGLANSVLDRSWIEIDDIY